MGDNSHIEWTDATWNPTRGCSRVSAGCLHCYAERQAARMSGPGGAYEGLVRPTPRGPRWAGIVRLVPEQLDLPRRWHRPRRIFVDSMSDLFHASLSDTDIDRVLDAADAAPWHTYQVLTKRAERMADHLCRRYPDGVPGHLWPGVSVEDQERADERLPHLRRIRSRRCWVSAEPLLGPLRLPARCVVCTSGRGTGGLLYQHAEAWAGPWPDGDECPQCGSQSGLLLDGIEWVVVGGESGSTARPFDLAWARSIIEQCRLGGAVPFLKQLGAAPILDGRPLALRHPKGGDMEEWPEDMRGREIPG